MSEPTYLTKREAADACGCSEATIQRYIRDGKLPNARIAAGGVREVAVADLVAAQLLDPLAATGDVAALAGRSRAERDLIATRQELAVAHTELARLRDEVAFLRSLLARNAA